MKKQSLSYASWVLGLVAVAVLFGNQASQAAELKQEALQSWDDYIQSANSRMKDRMASSTFLWVDEDPSRLKEVRAGKILVSPVGPHVPKPVPTGLIHDWIGVAYFPNTNLAEVLAVIQDYDHYQEYYKPSVVESKSLTPPGGDDRFSMVLVNKEVVAKMALDSEYAACYQKVSQDRWYGVAYTTRIQEIREYGHSGEHRLPPDQGSGYIWRLYSIARFEEREGRGLRRNRGDGAQPRYSGGVSPGGRSNRSQSLEELTVSLASANAGRGPHCRKGCRPCQLPYLAFFFRQLWCRQAGNEHHRPVVATVSSLGTNFPSLEPL